MLAADGCRHGAEVVHIPFIKGERADSAATGAGGVAIVQRL